MADENVFSRHAPPTNLKIQAGRAYLARIRSIVKQVAENYRTYQLDQGIDLFDESSEDFSKPFATVGVNQVMGAASSFGDIMGGVPLSNMPCIVVADERGRFTIEFQGMYYAWFEPLGGNPAGWSMVATNGLSQIIPCADPNKACIPFAPPFTASFPDNDGDGVPDSIGLSSFERAFCEATGAGSASKEWRLEYQACAADDAHNDAPPGIRSPWNFLASNCCHALEGNEDGSDGQPDAGGGPSSGPCENLALNCQIVVRQCHSGLGPFRFDFKAWCFIDGAMFCESQTGGRCICSSLYDVAGNNIPDPNTQPVGTVLFVRCEAAGAGNQFRKCSTIRTDPNGFEPWCDPL